MLTAPAAVNGSMLPARYRVARRRTDTPDTATLWLRPVDAALPAFLPGQFCMLYAFGVGEIPVSISGDPGADGGELVHTVRAVGAVSRALHDAPPGTMVGVRGPYGTHWRLPAEPGRDLLVVGGGLGLAPLWPAVHAALAGRGHYRSVTLVVGARQPGELLYAGQLAVLAARPDLNVITTVDRPDAGWTGRVGLVVGPMVELAVDGAGCTALLCGPEPMMRGAAELLVRRGVPPERIQLSLERNMKCGIGHCGHCQLGPLLTCLDGPVVDYAVAAPLMAVRQL